MQGNSTVLVTGGAHRLGRSLALALAASGARLVIHYHKSAMQARELQRQMQEQDFDCVLTSCDLSDHTQTENWIDRLIQEMGSLDLVINSASSYTRDNYNNLNMASLTASMEVHTLSPLIIIRRMYNQDCKSVAVNILDTRVKTLDPHHASYHLGKLGLHTLTRELAVLLAPKMRINAVAPGLITPPAGENASWLERNRETSPLQTHGNSQDVTDAVLYLASANFVTGQVIYVDGGRHLLGGNHVI